MAAKPNMQYTTRMTARQNGGAVVPVPFDPNELWGLKRQHPITGTINGMGIRGTVMPEASGWAFTIGAAWLRPVLPEGIPAMDRRDETQTRRTNTTNHRSCQAARKRHQTTTNAMTTPLPTAPDRRLAVARWRLHNQHLAGRAATDPTAVIRRLLAVQAENHSQASWAIASRCQAPDASLFQRLHDEGAILRTHVLRPTWHFVLPDDIGWLLDLTRPRVARGWERQLEQEGVTRSIWERAATAISTVLSGRHLTRAELGDHLATEGFVFDGHALMLVTGLSEVHGLICSGPTREDQHTYALFTDRVRYTRHLDAAAARTELVARYVAGHGPVTDRDLAYWASMPLGEVRAGLADNNERFDTFDLDGSTFWHSNEPPNGETIEPRAHLLQILDEYYRGYQHTRNLLDIAGFKVHAGRESAIGMLIVDSQIAGDMKRTVDADKVTFDLRLLRSLTNDESDAVHTAALRYGNYLQRPAIVKVTIAPSTTA